MSSEWKNIESCPANEYVWLANDDPKESENYAGEFSGVSVYPYLGKKVLSPDYPPRFHLTDNDGLAFPDPTLWMALKPPPPPFVWHHASPDYFPLSDELPIPEKPGGEINWQRISTCPVDEVVWLIDHVDTGPYPGKILKPSEFRAERTKVPLFCALENRTTHPNPVMWAKRTIDSTEPPAEPIDNRLQTELETEVAKEMERRELLLRCKNETWEKRELDERKRTAALQREKESETTSSKKPGTPTPERLDAIEKIISTSSIETHRLLNQIWGYIDLAVDARLANKKFTRENLEALNAPDEAFRENSQDEK